MIDDKIIEFLENRPQHLDFKGLVNFMKDTNINIKNVRLVSSLGIATLDYILIDLDRISKYSDSIIFFIILHEIAHYKRILKLGREEIIKKLSITDFPSFNDDIINEEIIADRYASLLFLKFNGFPFPRTYTQQLDNEYNKILYSLKTIKYFDTVKNSEDKYYELINKYVL